MSNKKMIAVHLECSSSQLARIPFEYIGVFQLNGLEQENDTKYRVQQFVISIDRNYKDNMRDAWDSDLSEMGGSAMDFLREYNRIICIERIYDDGSKDRISVDWFHGEPLYVDEKDGHNVYDSIYQNHNEYQRSKTNRHGDLFLEISEQSELDGMFPDEVINADDYTVGEMRLSQ